MDIKMELGRKTSKMSDGSLCPLSQRDAQSDVRSLPLTAEEWTMRHQRTDIKERPSIGVNIHKRL